jgi:hypothetical protein
MARNAETVKQRSEEQFGGTLAGANPEPHALAESVSPIGRPS